MTADDFRELAMSFPGVEERSHMAHPDFRVRGKIFASLGPDPDHGMVKLTPEQQSDRLATSADVFKPAAGKWGLGGATQVVLPAASRDDVRAALTQAYENLAYRK